MLQQSKPCSKYTCDGELHWRREYKEGSARHLGVYKRSTVPTSNDRRRQAIVSVYKHSCDRKHVEDVQAVTFLSDARLTHDNHALHQLKVLEFGYLSDGNI